MIRNNFILITGLSPVPPPLQIITRPLSRMFAAKGISEKQCSLDFERNKGLLELVER